MSNLVLINASCADQTVDAVVNAANDGLWAGGGICGVIFKKAGMAALAAACKKYKTPLKDGSAVITPAFQMKNTKYIIHAVGPDFGRTPKAFKELFDAYYNSLYVLMVPRTESSLLRSGGEAVMRAFKALTYVFRSIGCNLLDKLCAFIV